MPKVVVQICMCSIEEGELVRIFGHSGSFKVYTIDKFEIRDRKILIATGIEDTVPNVPGIKPLYGN